MPLPRIVQSSFSSGEISPTLYGRIDMAQYGNALAQCQNFLVRAWGGIDNRPGTSYIAACKFANKNARLIPFKFNNQQTYVLEFGDYYIRFYTHGVQIQAPAAPTYVSTTLYYVGNYVVYSGVTYYCIQQGTGNEPDISPAYWTAQTVYEIPSPYAYTDLPNIKFTQSADVITLAHQNYAPQELSRYGDNSWTLGPLVYQDGPFQNVNIDPTALVYASAVTGAVTITCTNSIFNANHVGALFRMDENDLSDVDPWEPDKMLVANNGGSPYGMLRRSDGKVYFCTSNFNATNLTTPNSGQINTGTWTPTHDTGVAADGDGSAITAGSTVYCSAAGVNWLYLHSGYGIVQFTAYISPTKMSAIVLSRLPDSVVSTGAVTYTQQASFTPDGVTNTWPLTAAPSAQPSNYKVTETFESDPGPPPVYYKQHILANGYTINTSLLQIVFNSPPPAYDPVTGDSGTNVLVQSINNVGLSTTVFSFGSWSPDAGYPSAVAYFDDRLCFGGSSAQPQTLWLSKTSQYPDFGESSPIVDSDGISETVNSRQINTIVDLAPLQNLLVMTTGGEMRMNGDQNGLISPSTVGVVPQSYYGIANNLRVMLVDNSLVYVQARGSWVRDMTYSFQVDQYQGDELTLYSNHLVIGYTIADMDFSLIPYTMLWLCRNDGTLLTCTYMKAQGVVGWARQVTTNGAFENVCVVSEGNEDVPYFIVNRTIGGQTVRYIERLNTRDFDTVADSIFMDAALSFNGTNSNMTNSLTVTGGVNWDDNENTTMTAVSFSPFASTNVGDVMVLTGSDGAVCRFEITGYTSSTVVTVRALADVPVSLQGFPTHTWIFAHKVFSGLNHLIGQTVSILSDGAVEEQQIVDNTGSVTLENAGGIVSVGLPITAIAQTLELNIPYMNAYTQSVRTIFKNIPKVSFIVANSRSLNAGPPGGPYEELKVRWEEVMGVPPETFTGTVEVYIDSTSDLAASVEVMHTDPLPLSLLAVIPEASSGQ